MAGRSDHGNLVRKLNPGTECAKELKPKSVVGRLGHDVRAGVDVLYLSKTTLGNRYLGSCIDEERSEMRFLV